MPILYTDWMAKAREESAKEQRASLQEFLILLEMKRLEAEREKQFAQIALYAEESSGL